MLSGPITFATDRTTGYPEIHNKGALSDGAFVTRFWVTGKNQEVRSFTIYLQEATYIKRLVFCSDKLNHGTLDITAGGLDWNYEFKNATNFQIPFFLRSDEITFSSKKDIGLAEIFVIRKN